MGCEAFDPRVSLVVIQKGFKKSWVDGWQAIGQEGQNAVTRIKEILAPETADFNHTYANINRRLHWKGDRLSVEHHLRRYTVWLEAHDAPEELINQSKLDRDVWSVVEPRVLKLENGQALFWLAMRTADAAKGVALQQIKKENGRLIQNSQLLPFDKLAEIEGFLDLLSEGREETSISVGEGSGLSTVGGWIVEGSSIDFGKNLPGLIDQAVQPSLLPAMISEKSFQFPSLSDIMPINDLPEIQLSIPVVQSIEPEKPISMATTSGFWFEMAVAAAAVATQNIVETPAPVFVVNKTTSGSDPEVTSRTVLVGPDTVEPVSQETEKRVGIVVPQCQSDTIKTPIEKAKQGRTRETTEVVQEHPTILIYDREPDVETPAPVFVATTTSGSDPEVLPLEAVNLITEQPLRERLPALEREESRSTVETERTEEVAESVVSENQDKSLILPIDQEAGGETVRIETMPHRDKTVLPIWEIKMQGISLDDIPEWNLSSVLIGEDLGWSMTVPGLKAEEELETNAERAFKLGKWSEFDYLKKAVEVVETILLVIVNTNWEQPPRLRRKTVKDFGGDWGSGSVKYRQIQR